MCIIEVYVYIHTYRWMMRGISADDDASRQECILETIHVHFTRMTATWFDHGVLTFVEMLCSNCLSISKGDLILCAQYI